MSYDPRQANLNKNFRQALTPGAGHVMPGAANALAARVIEATGHRMLMVSGAAVANTYLGVPDIGLVSLSELAGHVGAIRDAVNIPILIDGDTGFGNAISVIHTIRVLERAGANAIMLEDQTFPKRCGHFEGKDVISKAEMVQKIKAAVDTRAHAPAAWTPVSLLPMSDGSIDRFPHFVDRGKPGFIAVDPRGKRFVNEARSYHDFVSAMIYTCKGLERTEAYLLCDSKTLRRFGIGAVPPWPSSPKPYERTGYLLRADTLTDLAAKMHVGAGPLEHTVSTFNRSVASGKDNEFERGSDAYQHFNGSSLYLDENANPNLATICDAPFYAVRLVAGDIGSFIGLKVNGRAQVLDGKGEVIPGLYAAGNDITSIMGGTYPGAGITIGPALTFGLLASIDIARRANLKPAFEELA